MSNGNQMEAAICTEADTAEVQPQAPVDIESRAAQWRMPLADTVSALEIPVDRPRARIRDVAGERIEVPLDAGLAAGLELSGARHGATLRTTLLVSWCALLSRLSNQTRVVVGSLTLAGTVSPVEPLKGLVPLCVDLEGEPTLSALLSRTQRAVQDAEAQYGLTHGSHDATAFSGRSAQAPALQTLVSWREDAQPAHTDAVAYVDLSLAIHRKGDSLVCDFVYATALFDRATIVRYAGYWTRLLQAMIDCGESDTAHLPIASLPILDASERALVLGQWNSTRREYPETLALHAMFEAHASQTPDAMALLGARAPMTYAELNGRANRIAHRLIALGVGPDERVGICLERGNDAIACLIAVLKAGGAYVPIDANLPPDRIRHIIEDSAPRVVLTRSAIALPPIAAAERSLVMVDIEGEGFADESAENPDPIARGLTPQHLAYVIYTSGSTGLPKGVLIEHGSAVARIQYAVSAYSLTAMDRCAQFASLSFDASVMQLFSALSAGAALLMRAQDVWGPAETVALIAEHGLTVADIPPIYLQTLLDPKNRRDVQSLRVVVVGGEATLAESMRGREFKHLIINEYGPTEATITATAHAITGQSEISPSAMYLSIGRPIDNATVYILDRYQQPVPIGVVGELHIGGVGVARGYLNRHGLTAERFVPDPFSDAPGARMYKTGDLGRWLPDGAIDYIGRSDFQVKIRGFRIELGEIESKLCEFDGIREAVVLVREDESGEKQLVAYYQSQEAVAAELLRQELAAHVPAYMLPSAFVRMHSWPLTANGKVDRLDLPAPGDGDYVQREYVAAQGEKEIALAALWADLLRVERIGRNDNFFELGGHSLIALAMIERLRKSGISADVRTLFTAPTLGEFAESLHDAHDEERAPQNPIAAGTDRITPDMLPLVCLTQSQIDAIAARIAGGASSIQDIYPLSSLQQGILFHSRMNREDDIYWVTDLISLPDRERLASFVSALGRVTARHDIMRTAFFWENLPEPVQVVVRGVEFSHEAFEPDPTAGPVRAQLLATFNATQCNIDLSCPPLFGCRSAYDPESGRILLAIGSHHLLMDHASLDLVLEEAALIEQGRESELPMPVAFRDYLWRAKRRLDQDTDRAFFIGMLADIEQSTAAFGLVAMNSDGRGFVEHRESLPQALSDRLRQHARSLGVSVASIMHLAWAMVLSRATGLDRVVFGTVLFGRMDGAEGADRALGLYINTLPIRVDLDAGIGASEAVMNTHRMVAQLLQHEHASLAEAQRCSGVPATVPLFTSLFNYLYAADASLSGTDILVEDVEGGERTNYPLSISAIDSGTGFRFIVQVMRDVGAKRVYDFLRTALEQLADALQRDPATPICDLDAMPDDERVRLLTTGNDTARDYPRDQCVHRVFEAQVMRAPQAIALIEDGTALTYAEMNVRANRVAHRLIERGVRPDDRVAICMERSAGMIVGILGILKAGAGYVPIDANYPLDRIAYLLDDADPAAILTTAARRSAEWLTSTGAPILDIETASSDGEDGNPDVDIGSSRSLAYVIYTSGSTGEPKGVQVEHRNILRLAVNNYFAPIDQRDCVAHCSNPAFDASTWEIWAPLLNGARVLVVAQDTVLDPVALNRALIDGGVTALWLTVGLFNEYLDLLAPAFAALDHLLIGGDALDPRKVAQALRNPLRPKRLVNGYGPTETTTFAITHEIVSVAEGMRSIPLGTPIANTTIYLLDSQGRPVPAGVAGEIHIGGDGVARGYLNRPGLTAERFLRDPFCDADDGRMYRTGDLGRWLPDGTVEFLGRSDFQVKISGFRIELGEIEVRLNACDGVRDAVVLAREDAPGEKRLVAYWIFDGEASDAAPDAGTLRLRLQERLPDYMVPSAFVRLDAWPLTSNGKLDRSALPAPEGDDYASHAYSAPEGTTEEILASIWLALLPVERIGRHDNFFALGGHSLLAVQMLSRMRNALGVELALRAMFEAPTLAELAARATTAEQAHLAAIPAAERSACMPLSLAQQRLWFLNRINGASAAYHVFGAYRLHGDLNRAALERALQRVIDRHESLRTRFLLVEGKPMLSIADQASIELSYADLRGAQAPALDSTEARTSYFQKAFDLSAEFPLRARLLRLEDDLHELQILMHHIASDGWSVGVLLDELGRSYAADVEARPDPLQPLAVQYSDYAQWQRQWLADGRLERQSAYWRKTLADAPELLALPADRPRPQHQSYAGDLLPLRVDAALTSQLKALGQRHGVTLYMTLLASWAAVLSRLSNQSEVVVGSPVAGRDRAEIEPLIGFFVNTLALRIDLQGQPTVGDLLSRTRHQVLEARAHQDLPFDQVVEAVKPARSTAHAPIFQTLFAWQNQETVLDLDGLRVEAVDVDLATTEFDLTLSLQETSDVIAGDVISGEIHYATDLFDRETVARFADYWQRLLRGMADSEATAIAALPILGDAERRRVLDEWNATARDYPSDVCLHQLFEAQVAIAPDAVALVCGEVILTYAELDMQAERLAQRLRAHDVRPGCRIAICTQRNPAMVVAVLAALKAGGVYVPLDPAYPPERLAYQLGDAEVTLLLADATGRDALRDTLDAEAAPPLLILDDGEIASIRQTWESKDRSMHAPGPRADDTAYIIYTSGSTGLPKGTMVPHRCATNMALAHRDLMTIDADSRVLQFASFAFDVCVAEIFSTLASGAALVLPTPGRSLYGDGLIPHLREFSISHALMPPALLSALPLEDIPPTLHTVVLGGEVPDGGLIDRLIASRRVINAYGPTEATVCATMHTWASGADARVIGTPLPNVRIYLLDGNRQPVPTGVIGEIHVGGAGVADGYWNRPELSAERFLSDPFAGDAHARMYATGDLGRWLPDGTVEFLGRSDFQVKIRGFRVELGEIEAQLTALQGVREAVVVARADRFGETRLVAYLLSAEAFDVASLRAALSKALPEYMLPTACVHLDAFPLTPNGKIDRKALPAPDADACAGRTYAPAQGDVERTVVTLWQELLGIDRIGRHDNFFELGGHSLIAVTMIERMRKLGLRTDVRALFTAQTLMDFAASLDEAPRAAQAPANLIPAGAERIVPAMLPLVSLTQGQIDAIAAQIHGGAPNIEDIYPLSSLQEGMLFQRLLTETGDPYHATAILGFDDRDSVEDFLATMQQVIDRHDVLRTAFVWNGLDQPLQVVLRKATFECPALLLDPADGPVRLQLSSRFSPTSFRMDLTHAPLFRGGFAYDAQSDRWLLCVVFHHMLMDHTSLEIVVREATLIGQGRAAELPKPAPYRNYIWQAKTKADLSAHQAFFAGMLGGIDQPTAPFGLTTMVEEVVVFDEHARALPTAMSLQLRQRARELGVGTAAIMHLAWALVLSRATGMSRVVFGTVLFGRMDGGEDADRALGLFINSLPIRIDLDDLGIVDAIQRSQIALAELLPHEHASLATAQRCSGVPASSPLFTSLINYRYSSAQAASGEHSLIDAVDSGDRTNYPLAVAVDDFGTDFEIAVQVLPAVGAARVCDYLQTALSGILAALATDTDTPVASIEVMPAAEFERIVHDWNDTSRAFPLERCAHQLFAEQAARRPEATAVVYGEERLSYGELNVRANRLAHHLRACGVGPGTLVAVALVRGIDLVVTLLGVLKAGGAYVPIAPDAPADRVAFMLSDAKPQWLLAHRAAQLPESVDVPLMILEDLRPELEQQPDSDPVIDGMTSAQLIYVIYTSGTTGTPKGIAVTHRNLVNFVCWCADMIAPGDAMTQFAPYTFDASTGEIFACLLAGGELHVLEDATIQNPQRMQTYLVEHRIRFAAFPPSYLQYMDPSLVADDFQLLTAGSAPTPELVRRWAERGHYLNGYGPTETTILSTTTRLSADEETISIGRPIANTRVYLLDERRRPVPIGAAGEIWIGGEGVTRGYLYRPELTAECFLDDPFCGIPGARIYKTGDLGRWLTDGSIEFLGRSDFQVKIRGFRIELGEIESRLCTFEQIREAVVLAREDGRGEMRLVAYYLAAQAYEASALRPHLAQSLPDYMLPAAFVRMDAWPLTVNGKIDRKALPAPEDDAYARRAFEPARSEAERVLAAIWSDLLNIEQVGRNDHFFELGGHSLLAVQLVSRVRQSLGVELPLRALFEAPILCDLAERAAGADVSQLSAIPVVERTAHLPLSLAQQRLWFLTRIEAASAAYHMGGAVRLHGHLDRAALSAALQRIVHRHEALRTRFLVVGGEPVQNILTETVFAPEYCDLSGRDDREAVAYALGAECFARPFDLGAGPLLRVLHAQLDDDEHLLYLVMHHIIGDGWSIGVLMHELNLLYNTELDGEPDPLPPLAIQYADYAAWQRQWLDQDECAKQLAFWRHALHGAPTLLTLPTDRPRPAVQDFAGAMLDVRLDAALTAKLRAFTQEHGVTLYMVLLAGWAALLGRLSNQDDVVIGTSVAGRNRAEIEPLIGFFVNTLALRFDLTGEPTVAELLARTRHQVLEAQAHQDLPFDQVVEAVKPARSTAHSPIFQTMLTLNNQPLGRTELQGLKASPAEIEVKLSKFDLSLDLVEGDREIDGMLTYASGLFDRSTIQRYAKYWLRLLVAMLDAGDTVEAHHAVPQLPILGANELSCLLDRWNGSAHEFPDKLFVHQLFEAQAERAPEAIALTFGREQLTYIELNRRANRVAHLLRASGVRSDDRVGICIERGPDLIVAILATLKSGGAYVPIDPSMPKQRLDYLLRDSEPKALLIHAAMRSRWGAAEAGLETTVPWICLDRDAHSIAAQSDANPDPCESGLTMRDLAYVIYTSGSTGAPKGVMVEHRQLLNYLFWALGAYPEGRAGSVLSSSIAFDATVTSLYLPLLSGGRAWLIREGDEIEGLERLLSEIDEPALIKITPAHLAEVGWRLQARGAQISPKLFVVGGEAVPSSTVVLWRALCPQARIINEYGPTETAVGCIVHEVENDTPASADRATREKTPLAKLPMLCADEMSTLLEGWNDTTREFPENLFVHQLFEAQVERAPDAIALIFNRQELTYAELNRRANLLAHRLGSLGVKPGDHVGICTRRGIEMLVAVLAVLKSGSAYVPLDIGFPRERLLQIVEDSQPTLVLADEDGRRSLGCGSDPMLAGSRIIGPSAADVAPDAPDHNPVRWPDPRPGSQLAYVMFTSGSTGRPKGVCVPHSAVVNFISAMAEDPGLTADDTLCAVTTLSFDISVLELLLPLSVGARLVLADRETAMNGAALMALIDNVGATVIQATPATWRMLIDAGWNAGAGMRLLCGGEAWQTSLADRLTEGGARLWNMYGPTETTVWSMTAQIAPSSGSDATTTAAYLPIGRPIANTKVYILDRHLQPVPIGVTGELYIAGAGVARGYLDRPELTAERFMVNPFDATSARMYKTGDLCRWLPDGNIEYLGRNDFQVKIRGFRIELGEIESRLCECDGVREAVVLAREDSAGEKRLVAYCLTADGFDVAAVRAQLSAELPAYMVAAAFVRMEAWPLTPNGKIDRTALPAPDGDAYAHDAYEAPETPVERAIASVWQRLLDIDRVGRNDDFFSLGGHSLLLLRMIATLNERGIVLTMTDIYRHTTLAAIAAAASVSSPAPEAWLHARRWWHAAGVVSGVRALVLAPSDESGLREFRALLARCEPALRPERIFVAADPDAALLQAQADADAGLLAPARLDDALECIRAGSTRSMTGTAVRVSIAFTAMHREMALMEGRDNLHVVPLPGWWSREALCGAFAQIVLAQDMLHTVIDPDAGLLHTLDVTSYRADDVPFIDLRTLSAVDADAVIGSIVAALRVAKTASPTGYSAAVISRSDTDHLLAVYGDHLLWDGRSFDAIGEAMIGILTGFDAAPARPYCGFADACARPHAPEALDLAASEFDTVALAATMRATATALQARAALPPQLIVASFEDVGADSAERAFSVFRRLVSSVTGLDRFGLVLTHHGRQLGADSYFGQVGLFIDKIPVDAGPDTTFESSMRRIGALHRNSIRYVDWHDSADTRVEGTLPPLREEISFNWQPVVLSDLEIETAGLDNALARLESTGIICEFFAGEKRMDMVFAYRGSHEGIEDVTAIIRSASGIVVDPATNAAAENDRTRPDPVSRSLPVQQNEAAIVVDNVRKRYDQADVVKGISFTVPKGSCFGILGPNGAGKTSLLGMIEGIVPITSGRISVMGMDVATHIRKIQPKFGVQLQSSNYFPFLTVAELIAFYSELRAAASGKHRIAPATSLLERLDLVDKMKFKVEALSGGQKQRLSLVLALLAEPEIIFLDEPTAALDPHSRRYTWEFIEELKQDRRRTIVLTTHYMEEAERLCDEIMIMNQGEIVGQGNPSSMIADLNVAQQIRIRLDSVKAGESFAQDLDRKYQASWDTFSDSLLIATDDVANALRDTLSMAESRHVSIESIQVDRLSLEDVFLKKTGKDRKQ
jgi:amino acid adenylation domain-containing protein